MLFNVGNYVKNSKYNMSKDNSQNTSQQNPNNSSFIKHLCEGGFLLASTAAVSKAVSAPLSVVIHASKERATNPLLTYREISENLAKNHFGNNPQTQGQIRQMAQANFSRRTSSFIPINVLTDMVSEPLGMGVLSKALLGSGAETILASTGKAQERFERLATATNEKQAKEFLKVSNKNYLSGTSILFFRNLVPSAIASSVNPAVHEACDEFGIANKYARGAIDFSVSTAMAVFSIPVDNIFSQLSSGQKRQEQVAKEFTETLTNPKQLAKLFRGGSARVLSVIISGYSQRLAKDFGRESYESSEKFYLDRPENDLDEDSYSNIMQSLSERLKAKFKNEETDAESSLQIMKIFLEDLRNYEQETTKEEPKTEVKTPTSDQLENEKDDHFIWI